MITQIEFKNVSFTVDYDYQPGEKAIYYPNDKAHPGCPAQVYINEITHSGTDFMEVLEDHINEIEILILENHAYNF